MAGEFTVVAALAGVDATYQLSAVTVGLRYVHWSVYVCILVKLMKLSVMRKVRTPDQSLVRTYLYQHRF